MRRVRIAGCLVGVAAVLATGGCGASGSGSSGSVSSGAGPTRSGSPRSSSSGSRPTAGPTDGGRAVQTPIQSRGAKGENPTAEAATDAHLSLADCKALGELAERQTGNPLKRQATPAPPLSRCRLSGPGAAVNVYLDAGFAANQRYHNRIEETVQFNGQNPDGLPQPVPHVGERAAYNSAASWIPALGSLLAVRGNRWLTVTISVAGRGDRQLLAEAAVLARAGFKLSAAG